jgi:hypothetical protein
MLGWAAGIAAVVAIAVAATALVVGGRGDAAVAARDAQLRAQADVVAALSRVTTWTLRIDSQPDVRRIPLASSNGTGASGTLAFSPASGELVVVASGLAEPPRGQELRCWFDADGQRRPIGKMFFGGGLAYWAGHVDELGQLPPDSSFGVSMVEIGGDPDSGPPVLSGTL